MKENIAENLKRGSQKENALTGAISHLADLKNLREKVKNIKKEMEALESKKRQLEKEAATSLNRW